MQISYKIKRMKHKIGRIVLPDSPSSSSVPFAEYFKWFYFTKNTPDYPQSIDIQTQSGCNARCTFCGVGREVNKIHGRMSDDLFKKIIDEVIEYPNLRRLDPYLLNDPLVDKRMPERIEYIARKKGKRKSPKVRITTNAGLLTEEMGYRLLHAEGLDEINFSFHSIIPEVYEKMMFPLKFERVMGNILRFKEQWNKYRGKKPRLNVWTVKTQPVIDNLKNEKAYWKKVGIGFKARKLDNRANKDIELLGLGDREFVRVPFCVIPFWRAWIMWNGDMIMCCVDQERTNLLGNCRDRSVKEVWTDPRYQELRRRWRTRELEGLLCDECKGT
ncbi:MAG: radical SAM/SPASM domain-containing protein [Calditrichaeota bacterium]|nr:MAG: radical SAM/SPASM domain-containing protein [Calditrichota bacterium]